MRPIKPRTWLPSFPQLLMLVVFAGVLLRSSHQTLRDPDTYLHLAAGQWMLSHWRLPLNDPFSYTMSNQPWMIHEWLSEVLLQVIFSFAGWGGLVTLAALMFGLTLAYLYRFLLDRIEPIYALAFCALAFYGLGTHLLVRPHLLTWPILAIWLGQLIQACEQGKSPPYWLLTLMVLWANLHGGFILGIALIVPFAIEACLLKKTDQGLRWFVFLILAILASMLTPLGWKGWWLSSHLLSLSTLNTIGEWASPGFNTLNPIELWLVLLLALGLFGMLKLNPVRLVLLLLLLHQALAHGRFISLFSLITPMLIADGLVKQPKAKDQPIASTRLDALFAKTTEKARLPATLLTAGVIGLIALIFNHVKTYQPAQSITPATAINQILKSDIRGNVLNFYNFGAYLIYRKIPVFIDGRADLYGDLHIRNYQTATESSNPDVIEKLLTDHKIAWTIFPPGESINLYLAGRQDWKRFYQDKDAVVYVRSSSSPKQP